MIFIILLKRSYMPKIDKIRMWPSLWGLWFEIFPNSYYEKVDFWSVEESSVSFVSLLPVTPSSVGKSAFKLIFIVKYFFNYFTGLCKDFSKLFQLVLVDPLRMFLKRLKTHHFQTEANMINRMVHTSCTYHKERSFVSNCVTFLKILFQCENLL